MRKQVEQNEYAPYYQPYVEMVADGEFITILSEQMKETIICLKALSDV